MSGVVTEYRGGPLPGVVITARPNFPPGNGVKTVVTDTTGFYRIEGLTEPIIIDSTKDGYWSSGFGAFTGDRVLNLTMSRQLNVSAGQTLSPTTWGDSEMAREDWTGSDCGVHDSRGVHSNGLSADSGAHSRPGHTDCAAVVERPRDRDGCLHFDRLLSRSGRLWIIAACGVF